MAAMAVRTPLLLLGFIAGSIFGAAALWWFEDSPIRCETVAPGGRSEGGTAGSVTSGDGPGSRRKKLEACSEELERAGFELARERAAVARLSEALENSRTVLRKPLAESPLRKSHQASHFDGGALRAIGFAPKDIEWIRERWRQSELEKSYLAELEARDEAPPPGEKESDIERELREDLGDNDYDAMLYATNQDNRVALGRVRAGSIADGAGLRDGNVVWSYDGQRVFRPRDLATLSTTGTRGESIEIVIVTENGTESLFVERNPLGADLVSATSRPNPN